jgi:hypothetical protein
MHARFKQKLYDEWEVVSKKVLSLPYEKRRLMLIQLVTAAKKLELLDEEYDEQAATLNIGQSIHSLLLMAHRNGLEEGLLLYAIDLSKQIDRRYRRWLLIRFPLLFLAGLTTSEMKDIFIRKATNDLLRGLK